MDLEFEKYCKVDQSPRTVLPSSHHHAKLEKSIRKPNLGSKNNQLILEEEFKKIKLCDYHRSVSCKTLPKRNKELLVGKELHKRGSVYQSSKERTSVNRHDSVNIRKKIEFSVDTPFSFSLLDSICGSDHEEEEEEAAERDFMANSKYKSHEVVFPSSNANILMEDDNNHQFLHKSLSAKLALPHSPIKSRNDGSDGSRFTPIRMIHDPSTKLDSGEFRSLATRNKALQKSLLYDFSCATQFVKKDQEKIAEPSSPAHLHGDLKLEYKHGVPYFVLSLPHSDTLLVAKTWKAEDALNWVYTFHSIQGRKKSKYNSKDSSMVGQMKVSCHLCSELKKSGAFSDSMITEFVLYDILHARKSLENQELDSASEVFVNGNEPWESAELHPSNEIAAIVIQVPFEKRESLKHSQAHSNLLDLSLSEQTQEFDDTTMVNVVAPLGNHSLPTCESKGPLSLLDRWRQGGGCDCGGWEMACPLLVFDNLTARLNQRQNNQPFKLYLQGTKEKTPAMTMKLGRKGHYLIDFHAQLSALQALAICVSVLHASEASSEVDQEKHRQLMQCRSKKDVIEDQLKILIDEITEEEKKQNTVRRKAVKATEDHPHSFVLNPPFSPIARV
ncbi:hypothetical protein V2J09_020243 [Rumex salicifolius]